ncbi:hypothetical protein BOX15_Mlig001357g1 [Macrostomum lignano]|uniref:Uncharacterized protein n=1 Tax=Macrostomum lignano TaxID=282301 RepID=A0A267DM41_9PLAT|nr:hypothetical protein BOX15_Mlig001357g1 [Macrostomum lignano]
MKTGLRSRPRQQWRQPRRLLDRAARQLSLASRSLISRRLSKRKPPLTCRSERLAQQYWSSAAASSAESHKTAKSGETGQQGKRRRAKKGKARGKSKQREHERTYTLEEYKELRALLRKREMQLVTFRNSLRVK